MRKDKVKKFVKKTQKYPYNLRPDDIEYIIELANKHPGWSAGKIFEEALRPRIRSSLIIPLTPNLKSALEKAAKTYQISQLAVTYHILKEWLKGRKFLEV